MKYLLLLSKLWNCFLDHMVLVFVFLLGLALSFAYWKIKSSLKEQIFSLVEVQKVSQISKVNPKEKF